MLRSYQLESAGQVGAYTPKNKYDVSSCCLIPRNRSPNERSHQELSPKKKLKLGNFWVRYNSITDFSNWPTPEYLPVRSQTNLAHQLCLTNFALASPNKICLQHTAAICGRNFDFYCIFGQYSMRRFYYKQNIFNNYCILEMKIDV